MDRQIVYTAAVPLETDLLNAQRYTMTALGFLMQTVLGTSTLFQGLACTPTSPASMQVQVGPGSVYSLQNLDNTAYSSLAADTTHQIVKQGIVQDTQTFTITAPTTAGYSQVYLVEAAFLESDTNALVLPYYNSSNPAQAYTGPNNSGVAQNTLRKGICSVQVKAGVAAATGSQTTPAADTGYTALYTITVAQGQSTIVAGNIATVGSASMISETLTQKISIPTGDARYLLKTALRIWEASDTGSVNAYAATLSGQGTPQAGDQVSLLVTNTNTGASTFNGVAVKKIGSGGTLAALAAGDMVAGTLAPLEFDGTQYELLNRAVSTGTLGTAASKNLGNTVIDPGTGSLEVSSPFVGGASPTTGATRAFLATDRGQIVRRSNSGAAMTDTLPGTSPGVLAAGWLASVMNSDPFATLTVAVGSGAVLDNGVALVLMPGQSAMIGSDGVNYWTERGVGRIQLRANTTFYVSTSGNDTTGFGTSAAPWATWQRAWNVICSQYDLAGYAATITDSTANQAFTAGVIGGYGQANGTPVGNGLIIIDGNGATITASGAVCFNFTGPVNVKIQNFTLTGTSTGGVYANSGAVVGIGSGMTFGAMTGGYHMYATSYATINSVGTYTVSGNFPDHWYAYGGTINVGVGTITIVGSPNLGAGSWAVGQSLGQINCAGITFSNVGGVTGTKYTASLNSTIYTGGAGASYLPGSVAGSTSTGGQYL